jgi:signal transduction histidine kinase
VEDVSIPVTVIRCDYKKESHMRYLFTIFYRLNSGGVRLNNQEIRNCIYTGPFNDALKRFDKTNSDWRSVKARIWGRTDRFRSVEILLRTLAFGDWLDRYDGNLAGFLNTYMHEQTVHPSARPEVLVDNLAQVANLSYKALADSNRKKVPLALVEAILVAVLRNRAQLAKVPDKDLQEAFQALEMEPAFVEGLKYAVSAAENVRGRIARAVAAFAF